MSPNSTATPELASVVARSQRRSTARAAVATCATPTSIAASTSSTRDAFLAGAVATVDEVEPAVIAAVAGQVASIFVPVDREYWGRYRPGHRVLEERDTREPGDHDLADVVASETLRHGGMAFVVPASEIPGAGTAASPLRY